MSLRKPQVSTMGNYTNDHKGRLVGRLGSKNVPSTEQINFDSPSTIIDRHTGAECQRVLVGYFTDKRAPMTDRVEVMSALGLKQDLETEVCCGSYCERSPHYVSKET